MNESSNAPVPVGLVIARGIQERVAPAEIILTGSRTLARTA